MKKRYELVRTSHLRAVKIGELVELSETPTVIEIVDALVDARQHAIATEFLFGNERDGMCGDRLNHMMFMHLWCGNDPGIVKAIARNHAWHDHRPQKGFSIQVHEGEWMSISEPTATKYREAVLHS